MTKLPSVDLSGPLKMVFRLIFLKVVLPFVLLILISSVFRIIFRMVLKRSPTAFGSVPGGSVPADSP